MKKQQLILIASCIVLLGGTYFFGKTVSPKKNNSTATSGTQNSQTEGQIPEINIENILSTFHQKLTTSQQAYVSGLEAAVVRGDVKEQQIKVNRQLAAFWQDSAKAFLPYAWYTAEAAKLENSEKNLTFAARLFLNDARGLENQQLRSWEASQAKQLFEKALVINPDNDSTKIGLGSTYIFGGNAQNPQELMQGIQKILEVAKRDSTNMYAQLMLGIGGINTAQYDKAIERLHKVVAAQPKNLEAIFFLAEAYERKGDKANAIKWYQVGKKEIPSAAVQQEIDARIEMLKK